ncbi:Sec34-like family-domain-containing protein [Lipomyces oligophaga]|uniref:Sec34-like family-domain-containing protein n=1 Tax=Lipomyces oligophaga TaxID=45792 RepID=UPI0034CFFFEF
MSSILRLRRGRGFTNSGSSLSSYLITYPFTKPEKSTIRQATTEKAQYLNLYDEMQKELQEAEDLNFVQFRDTAQSHLESCRVFMLQADRTLKFLDALALGFDSVKRQTSSFQASCDALSVEQQRLDALATEIENHLVPFNMLEEITKRLNVPGTDFVAHEGFKQMLATLDRCIEYTETHPNFNGIDLYQMRFKQCMTRALTLIRVYFINSIREVTNDVQSRIAAKALNDATQSALFYTKFRVDAPILHGLMEEIQTRSEGQEEYSSLLGDCFKYYNGVRAKLVLPVITKQVTDMRNTLSDLLQLTRQSLAYIRTVCSDEYELFYAIFPQGEDVVYELLDSLCEPLQDILRNRIIHEKKAEVLYELCSLLQGLSAQEGDYMDEEYFGNSALDLGRLFQSTLQDAQMKLVFRMQAYS